MRLNRKALERKLVFFLNAKKCGNGWIAKCPAHEDKSPSLSLNITETGKLLWKCHAGCSQMLVFDSMLKLGFFPSKKGGANGY